MDEMQMDEISLRELIETLLRQRKLIAGITILCLLTAFVVSYFVLEPIYESKTILMASAINKKAPLPEQDKGIEGLLNTMSQYPQMTIETYKEQINSPQILQQTIKELKLEQYNITRKNLKNMISLNTIKDTNLISISIKYSDKKIATDIANTIANKFIEFVSNQAKEQAVKSSNFIEQQMEIEKKNLDVALLEYKTYLSQPRGMKELEKEVDSKLELITQYKTNLVNSKIEEEKIKSALSTAQQTLENTPSKITLNKSLSDEPYMSQIVGEETNQGPRELYGIKVETEEINEAYIALKKRVDVFKITLAETISQKNNIQKQINNTQKELEVLQSDSAEKQHEERIITQKVDFAQTTYEAFLEKYEETRIAKSSAIGDSTIIIVSPAVEPLGPVGPRKALNMAIAGILGIMIGMFIGFFREYWKNSGTENKKEEKLKTSH